MAPDVSMQLTELICRHLSVVPALVTPSASLVRDLGADSLDVTELIMAIEEAFQIEITDEDATRLGTVADAAALIAAKLAAGVEPHRGA